MKFTEAKLEAAIIALLSEQGYPHRLGASIERAPHDVLIEADLRAFLQLRYGDVGITKNEIDSIILRLRALSPGDLYESNKTFCGWLADGFLLKREDPAEKDLHIQLFDDTGLEQLGAKPAAEPLALVAEPPGGYAVDTNRYALVSQLKIEGKENTRIPDAILYINGLPLVVFEFKSAIGEHQTSIFEAWKQLTVRYRRDIPQLFVFNALCIISDGVNSRMGSLFAAYEFFYSWRKVSGHEQVDKDGIDSLHSMMRGLFDQGRLRLVLRDFIFFPDKTHQDEKIVCRYPQFYAVNKLYHSIMAAQRPKGNGKGGTYFGATGCGKSFTMQFLARRLMKSLAFESPTIVLITDRTDLDDQLSRQFTNARGYIGDNTIVEVQSREHLREQLAGRRSGGIFLTTIHKFTEDTKLLTERSNVICISDEAHRSQVNLDQKVQITEQGVRKAYGFAFYLHRSLPNATYVGFTGTPIDATLDVFGEVVDSYTMSESVNDEITVRIVYEGRAAKVTLDDARLREIENYYEECAKAGSNEHQIEESKKAMASMNSILGDPDRIRVLAEDFVAHYERRLEEGSTVCGKAMFVSSSREIAWQLYQAIEAIRPEWLEIKAFEEGSEPTTVEREKLKPMARVNLVMTRGKNDAKALYELLGSKEYRKTLDQQFKRNKSNFKIAIVVDMWLTGFDVPSLDTLYIDKPVQRHNLIQTISRVNRNYADKHKGLIVDYIGIKRQMNQALAQFSKADETSFEDIQTSLIAVKNDLDLLAKLMHGFDDSAYFKGEPLAQLDCLNRAAEFVLSVGKREKRFMSLVKRLKAAYDVCCGSEKLSQAERDRVHFYLAIRSIVYKLTKGDAPDTAQMNAKVREMISEALRADGVESVFALGEESADTIDIFDEDYLARLDKIKLPNTKIELLKQLLAKALNELKKTNQHKAIEFSKKFRSLVELYNERKEEDAFTSEVHQEAVDSFLNLMTQLKEEMGSFEELGITVEEKAFYDILKAVALRYQFAYEEERLLALAADVKAVVDDKTKYPDWNNRQDIKAALRVELIMLLSKNGYPPVTHAEVYRDVFEQAENFKPHRI
tara:strand:- start:23015 stop:26236 length:3222 start_codon:yes stop_codon:yes gene_type:complete